MYLKTLTPEKQVSESGLRFLNPGLGRWTARDPIGERGGPNIYALLGNNPVFRVDPHGLAAATVGSDCCEQAVDAMKEIYEIELVNWRECFEEIVCEADCSGDVGRYEEYPAESGRWRICIKRGRSWRRTIETIFHEVQHAADQCTAPDPDVCEEQIELELRANFCAGLDFNDAVAGADRSISERICPRRRGQGLYGSYRRVILDLWARIIREPCWWTTPIGPQSR